MTGTRAVRGVDSDQLLREASYTRPDMARSDLRRVLDTLGPLETRIMRPVWKGRLGPSFVVRDAQTLVPELAYTTVMTTLNRLAAKGLLEASHIPGERAHRYQVACTPTEYLAALSRRELELLVERLGDSALAALAARLDEVPPEELERLRGLAQR